MKKYLVTAISVMFLTIVAVSSQTPNSLREKYGPPDEKGRYLVRPGIGLQVTYDVDGALASLIIKPIDDDKTTVPTKRRRTMPRHVGLELLDELVPASHRAKAIASFSEERGCFSLETKDYPTITTKITTRCERQGGGTYSIQVIRKKTNR